MLKRRIIIKKQAILATTIIHIPQMTSEISDQLLYSTPNTLNWYQQ